MKEYINKIIAKILTLLEETPADQKALSMMRFLSACCVLIPLITWSAICIQKLQVVDIPWGVVAIIGLGITGKVVQYHLENNVN